jgi:hypothetical protein
MSQNTGKKTITNATGEHEVEDKYYPLEKMYKEGLLEYAPADYETPVAKELTKTLAKDANKFNYRNMEEHANVTPENITAITKDTDLHSNLLSQAAEDLSSEFGFNINDALIKKLLKEEAKEQWEQLAKNMPEKVYRGQKLPLNDPTYNPYNPEEDPEQSGFGIPDEVDENGHALTDEQAVRSGRNVTFVSSDPATAASYARTSKFDRVGNDPFDVPSNFGDYIYEILTQGLDPALFEPDDSSTLSEYLYGPQFKYKGKIPQENINIVDKAGNSRTVPRIQRVHFGSDANIKDVYYPKHLLDAVRKRY